MTVPYELQTLKAEEVAELLGIDGQGVYKKIRAGVIPAFYVGRTVRFRKADLVEWMQNGGTQYEARWRKRL